MSLSWHKYLPHRVVSLMFEYTHFYYNVALNLGKLWYMFLKEQESGPKIKENWLY